MTSLGRLGTELDEGIASFGSGVAGCRTAAAGRVEALLGRAEESRRVLAGYEARLVALADELSADGGPGAAPEDVLGRGGVSSAEAGRRARRQRSITDLPEVSGVVGAGRANPECLDRLAGARSRLEGPAELAAFVARDADLAEWVASLPPRRFARRVNQLVDRIARDAGRTPAGRGRREAGLRLWQGADGLYRLDGVFGIESAEVIGAALEREMAALARTRPEEAGPVEGEREGHDDDPGSRRVRFDDRLRAEALVEMLARAFRPGSEIARPLINVLVDAATLADGPGPGHADAAEWAQSGETIGPDARNRLQCGAFWQRILYDPATGHPLDVGRSKRVATARQRRALRALYSTCAFGHCDRPFAWCHIHHINPWEADGPTDLENLVPLCSHHHHLVHEGRWRIRLNHQRHLEIRRPDGRWWGQGEPDGPIGNPEPSVPTRRPGTTRRRPRRHPDPRAGPRRASTGRPTVPEADGDQPALVDVHQ
ncbi:MAG: DUF222 domain-containing protein [Acidimicrobiales bacterium]